MGDSGTNFAGLDIGGANIKFASCGGLVKQIQFPFWKNKDGLDAILKELSNSLSPGTYVGVTMTAELADCFETKPEGVRFIVESVVRTFAKHQSPLFYRTDGTMCDAQTAIAQWELVAASNWHATAWLAFSNCQPRECSHRSGFVFDIGSTTTDIIPVLNGQPVNQKQTDVERLTNGQLFYAGVGRTPICGLLDFVQFDFGMASIAREFFATTLDAFIWLGDVEENANCLATADGRAASKENSGQRLARMVCADRRDLSNQQIDSIAIQTKQSLTEKLSKSLQVVLNRNHELPLVFKTFGGGAWLAAEVIKSALSEIGNSNVPELVPFSANETVNQTAAALAVAKRCQEHLIVSGAIDD